MTAARVLLVEDDDRIGSTLLRALTGNGFDARWVTTGADAISAADEHQPVLVLLDLGLPDMDGLDVCRRIHGTDPTIDIVMLTARDDELDVVVGLDSGAVDYITKPFKLAELMARLRAQLRRSTLPTATPAAVDDLAIDVAARRVWRNGTELILRAKEFDLLARLVADAGMVVTRETLMADVWDEHWYGSTKTLDFHIAALRRHLDRPSRSVSRISTIRGVGFRYEPT